MKIIIIIIIYKCRHILCGVSNRSSFFFFIKYFYLPGAMCNPVPRERAASTVTYTSLLYS